MKSVEALVPVIQYLILFSGGKEGGEKVKDIFFSGLTFSYSAWMMGEEGHNDRQAAYDIPAAVQAYGAERCGFEKCRFVSLGGYGIEWSEGSKYNRVVDCEFTDLGAGGIKIGAGGFPPVVYEDLNDPRISSHNEVSNCRIYNIGIVYPGAVGIWLGQSYGNLISHNHIYDTYYTGISAGWTWGYKISNAHSNIIEYNHIHHIGRGMLSDMGAIYTLGIQPGTIIRNNIIHDITRYEYGGWGIYLDEGSSNILVENNLVYKTESGGFHQHYGKENVIRNNIFAYAREKQIIRSREEEHISFIFEKNIVFCEEEPCFGGNWKNGKYRLDRNLYYRVSGKDNFVGDMSFDKWQETGQDKNSLFADPLFVDPENGNLRLKKKSRALHLGFRPFLK
jgi:parallel beta-helix repeat protein